MDRKQIIDVIKSHSKTVAETEIENLADHILAIVHAHYEKIESDLRVKNIALNSFGINHD